VLGYVRRCIAQYSGLDKALEGLEGVWIGSYSQTLRKEKKGNYIAVLENEVQLIQRKDGRVVKFLHGLKDLWSRPVASKKG
jgi:hypothetical protein